MLMSPQRNFFAWLLPLGASANAGHINPALGVLGYPDCVRRHPGVVMDPFNAQLDLHCTPKLTVNKTSIKVACVGDSITAGATATSAVSSYPGHLQNLLDTVVGVGTYSVTNLGSSGAALSEADPFSYFHTPQYKTLIANEWDIIIIMLGTNDAKLTINEVAFENDYKKLIDSLQNGHRKLFVASPPPLMENGVMGLNQDEINSVLPRILPGIASYNSAEYIDIFTAFGGSFNWKTAFPSKCTQQTNDLPCHYYCDAQSCDQCHPSDVGYEHLALLMKNKLTLSGLSARPLLL